MRHREMWIVPPSSRTGNLITDYAPAGGTWSRILNAESNSVERTEQVTTDDEVHLNFRKRIAAGEIINSPYTSSTVTQFGIPLLTINKRLIAADGTGYVWHGEAACPGMYHLPWPTEFETFRNDVISRAVTKAHARVDGSNILAIATAAEFGKTTDSILSLLRGSASVFRELRKFNIRALAKRFKPRQIAERYMEARYALRPLAYDIHGVIKTYQFKSRHRRQTFRGSAVDEREFADTIESSLFYETLTELQRSVKITVSARAGVMTSMDLTVLDTVGSTMFAESAWELIPFSFIADWFYNVGDTIASWTPNAGFVQLASWASVRTTRDVKVSLGSTRSTHTDPYWKTNTVTLSGPRMGSLEFHRERIKDPSLHVWPQFQLRLDPWKVLDLGIIMNVFKAFR